MKFTLGWLKDHIDTQASLGEITAKLTALGLEVESVHNPAEGLEHFIVAYVREAKQHPNADRLRLCTVETGTETLQVVCGAPNAHTGMKAVLARPGVRIPESGEILKKGMIRGVESQGMLCSTRELKLGEDHDGIIELGADVVVGVPITQILPLDPVIEVALTPNRVDALGVRGIARDLAAAGMGTLKPMEDVPVAGRFESPRAVAMQLPPNQMRKCPMFAGRLIRGVRNGESPAWLKGRLTAVGLRPVSVLVDITQYLTVDLGRPLHAFDDAKLNGAIGPRLARAGETVAALNGKTYTLDDTMVVIADAAAAQGIGGIMGGEASSVTESTTAVFLESALFDTINVGATGRALQINSDARYCFERGVDPASPLPGIEIATHMILKLCGGEPAITVVGGAPPEYLRVIRFDSARVKSLGGVDIADTEIQGILERLGFKVAREAKAWAVTPPSWRLDVESWQDLVEEVLRLYGYDRIPPVEMPRPAMPKQVLTPQQRQVNFARRTLAARGLNETVTWSFQPKAHALLFAEDLPIVPLANPISSDLDVLRPSLVPNLAVAAGRNAARGILDSGLFEVGPRFEGCRPGQQTTLAAVCRAGHTSPRHWAGERRAVDAIDAKADALAALEAAGLNPAGLQTGSGPQGGVPSWYHPGLSGALKLGNQIVATFGALHPRVLQALDVKGPMVACEVFLERVPLPKKRAGRALLKPSPLQPVERDFAFVMDAGVSAEAILKAVRGAERELIAEVGLFDVYQGEHLGEGQKSVAISVTLQPKQATLTDAEIDAVGRQIVAAVEKACGGRLRA